MYKLNMKHQLQCLERQQMMTCFEIFFFYRKALIIKSLYSIGTLFFIFLYTLVHITPKPEIIPLNIQFSNEKLTNYAYMCVHSPIAFYVIFRINFIKTMVNRSISVRCLYEHFINPCWTLCRRYDRRKWIINFTMAWHYIVNQFI